MKFCIKDLFSKCDQTPGLYPLKTSENHWFSGVFREYRPAVFVTFTEEILNGAGHFLCSCSTFCCSLFIFEFKHVFPGVLVSNKNIFEVSLKIGDHSVKFPKETPMTLLFLTKVLRFEISKIQ